jgi:drug/metabolite transporter (DMT)-like permease
MIRTIVAGAIAGAAGEMAIDVFTYGDMLARARPASEVPAKVAGRLAEGAGIELAQPGERADKAENRKQAGGALLGYATAIGVATGYAVLRRLGFRLPMPVAGLAMGAAAMALSDTTATALRVTDPTTWGAEGWIADIVPHAAYGLAAAATLEVLDHR